MEHPPRLVRLSTREFGGDTCPAHQRGRPDSQIRGGRAAVLIGAFRDAVIRRFTRAETPEGLAAELARTNRFGPIESRWLCAAVARFPDPAADGYRLTGRDQVIYHERANRELYGWGLWAYAEDHSAVRAYLPRYRAGGVPYARTRVLVTAFLAARGLPGNKPPFGSWYEQPHQRCAASREPEYVEVIEYYADTGDFTVIYEGTPDQAERDYLIQAAAMSPSLRRGMRRPGNDCGSCLWIGDCPAVLKVPGLLGVEEPGQERRSWSATNGRYYLACPRRDHLYRRNLPGVAADAPELVGRVVDAFLDRVHRDARPCAEEDVPTGREAWLSKGYDLAPEAADRATAMLRQHLPRCPWLAGSAVGAARQGGRVTVYDPVADVVVHAQVDLLYLEEDEWVWRELKTRRKIWDGDPLHSRDALQYAVAVLLARVGVDGRKVRRVEIEQIAEDGRDIHPLDPADPQIRTRAAELVSASVREWHANPSDEARPGPACAHCQYRVLCPDAVEATE